MADDAMMSRDERSMQVPDKTRVLATVCGAHALHDGLHDSIYVLLPLWAEALGLTYGQVGLLKSAYSGSLALLQMPAGILSERTGERALLALGTVLAGAAYAVLGLSQSFPELLLLIGLTGVASAVQHPLGSAIITKTYTNAARRAALGVYNFSGDVGKMTVALIVGALATYVGWRSTTLIYGFLVAMIGAAIYWTLGRVQGSETMGVPASGEPGMEGGWGISNRGGYTTLSIIHLLDSACRTGVLTFIPFVLLNKGATSATIGLAFALIFAGGAAGKLACGLLGARIGILRTVVLTELATAIMILVALASPLPLALLALPVLGIALNGTSSVLYGTVGEFVRPDRQARAFGLFYTLGSSASTASPALFGFLSDYVGVSISLTAVASLALLTIPFCYVLRPHLSGVDS
jgi:MFS transporter, FSR family, fosmidomycin resistance protein